MRRMGTVNETVKGMMTEWGKEMPKGLGKETM
jgi:hypothetical protein